MQVFGDDILKPCHIHAAVGSEFIENIAFGTRCEIVVIMGAWDLGSCRSERRR